MMGNTKMNESHAIETRLIKSTSKRQITIPKSFFDILSLENDVTFIAHLHNDGIFLKPQIKSQDSIWDEDRKEIIRQVVSEKLTGEELVEELNFRLKKYDEFLTRKIEEFDSDIQNTEKGLDDTVGVDNFNGLEVFFDTKVEPSPKKS